MAPRQLADVARCYERAGVAPEPLFAALARRAVHIMPSFQTVDLVRLARPLSHLLNSMTLLSLQVCSVRLVRKVCLDWLINLCLIRSGEVLMHWYVEALP